MFTVKTARLSLALVSLVLISACGKGNPPAPTPPPAPQAAPVAASSAAAAAPAPAPVPTPGAPAAMPAGAAPVPANTPVATTEEYLQVLNEALGSYTKDAGQLPPNVEKLVQMGMINRMPPAPPGKRYVIDIQKRAVVLSN